MYIKIIFNEGIVLSIVATGAIFIYTLGSFDISLGAATLFSATLGKQMPKTYCTGTGVHREVVLRSCVILPFMIGSHKQHDARNDNNGSYNLPRGNAFIKKKEAQQNSPHHGDRLVGICGGQR